MHDFRKIRNYNIIYTILSIICIVLLYSSINFFASKYHHRISFHNNTKCLNEKSREVLCHLSKSVEIYVILERTQEYGAIFDMICKDMQHLLDNYTHAQCNVDIATEIIIATENQQRYHDISRRFGILPTNCVIVTTNNKEKVLSIDEFYITNHGEPIAFRGEQILSTTLNELSSSDNNVIYCLTGHGENEIDSTSLINGMSSFKYAIQQRNCSVQSLNIYDTKNIPEDADIIIIAGAKSKFLGFEIELLRNFIETKNGTLIISINSNFDTGLSDLFSDYGIIIGDTPLSSTDDQATSYTGDIVIKRYAQHPINEKMIEFRLPVVFGHTCSVAKAPWAIDNKISCSELIATDETISDNSNEATSATIATLSTIKKFQLPHDNNRYGNLLVIGNDDFMTNGKFQFIGNRIWCLSIIDHFLKQEHDTFDIIASPIEQHRFILSKQQFRHVAIKALLIPAACLLLMVGMTFLRRK